MQAIIYIRFSTKVQEKGDSVERQLRDCSKFCRDRGWEVVDVIQDLGRSAYKGDHLKLGNLGKLTERILARDIPAGTVLVVEKLDRISRLEPRITQRWIEDVCATGLSVATVDRNKVYDDASLRSSVFEIMEVLWPAHVAHEHSKNLSDKVASAWQGKQKLAQEGSHKLSRSCPPWLSIDDKGEWVVNEERASIVREIYQMAADGIGAFSIANALTARGIQQWGRPRETTTMKGWGYSYVLTLLKGLSPQGDHRPTQLVNGKRVPSDRIITGYYPPIVDADLAARAKAAVLGRQRTGGKEAHKARNLFTGLASCKSCGGRMTLTRTTATGKTYWYLYCDNALRQRGCQHRSKISYAKLEPAVLDNILYLALDDSFFQLNDQSAEYVVTLAEKEKELTHRTFERDNARKLLLRFPDEEQLIEDWQRLSGEVKQLQVEREAIMTQLARARGQANPAEHLKRVHDVRESLDHADEEIRQASRLKVRSALKSVVTSMVIDPDDKRGMRTITVTLANGVAAFILNDQGKLLDSFNLSNQLSLHRGLTRGELAGNAPAVEAVKRRSKGAA